MALITTREPKFACFDLGDKIAHKISTSTRHKPLLRPY